MKWKFPARNTTVQLVTLFTDPEGHNARPFTDIEVFLSPTEDFSVWQTTRFITVTVNLLLKGRIHGAIVAATDRNDRRGDCRRDDRRDSRLLYTLQGGRRGDDRSDSRGDDRPVYCVYALLERANTATSYTVT